MARDTSTAKAGYYPLDEQGFDDIASVLRPSLAPSNHLPMLDPCFGRGESLRLARALGDATHTAWYALPDDHEARRWHRSPRNPGVDLRACELEETRAAAAKEGYVAEDRAAFAAWQASGDPVARASVGFPRPVECKVALGDAFRLVVPAAPWATLLYCNPPYDSDDHRRGGRLEERWLERFTRSVVDGGVLVFVVPLAAVGACASLLARSWTDVQVGRVREGAASAAHASTQVVVLARRVCPDLAAPDPATLARVEALVAGGVEALSAVIDLRPVDVPTTHVTPPYEHAWHVEEIDVAAALAEHVPWHRSVRRYSPGARRAPPLAPLREALPVRPWAELTSREFPTLMALKPSYVADAIASGALDGEVVVPADESAGLPPLRVKGMFDRRFREVEVKYDARGEARASVQVQRPALRVSVLDPQGRVHVLGDSGVPTGATDPADFTVGDLVARYGPSLADALARRCPVTGDAEQAPPIPPLLREPYAAQAAAVRAVAGRLLRMGAARREAGGPTPAALLQGQPGTGKTSMCLAVARTVDARRVLVVCPPHLVAEEAAWRSDAAAVLGPAVVDVRLLETPVDVDRYERDPDDGRMRLGIASREVAKLGHGYEGFRRCGRCGALDPRDASKLAEPRATCRAPALVPASPRGRLRRALVHLSRALAWAAPDSAVVGEGLPVGSAAHAHRARLSTKPVGERPGVVVAEALRACDLVDTWAAKSASAQGKSDADRQNARAVAAAAVDLRARLVDGSDGRDRVVDAGMRLLGLLRGASGTVAAGPPHRSRDGERSRSAECGEPLWQAAPRPRRWPLVRSLVAAAKRDAFDLLVLDEAHEYGNHDSAQAQAAERLVACGVPTILATGSICNGYMSSMHAHFRLLSAEYARDFARDDLPRAVARFGYQRRQVDLKHGGESKVETELGAVSDRVVKGAVKVIGQAPGVLPEALLRYLAPATAQVHLEDLGADLPSLTETVVGVEPTDDQRAGLGHLVRRLVEQIRADKKDPERAGKLFGQLSELPSFLDRCSLRPEWVVSYPAETREAKKRGERGPEVARLPGVAGGRHVSLPPPEAPLPKEEALVAWVAAQLCRGRPCLVYVWHWDLMPRIADALRSGLASASLGAGIGRWTPVDPTALDDHDGRLSAVAAKVDVLDPGKVPPAKREAWITKSAASRCAVLLTNPAAVKTGINSLARWWSSAAWYEGPGCSPEIRRQATHRLWRIGQHRPVEVASFVYAGTMQAKLHELLMTKVGVSEAVDGLDASAALAAAGVGEQDATAALEVGRALYAWCERDY